jgi:adenine phosphoribosyltransferase
LVGFAFVIELKGLGGRTVLPKDLSVESLLAYD